MASARDVHSDCAQSESRYCASLAYLCHAYVGRIEAKVNPRHLVELHAAFAALKSLHAFHASLHSQLVQRAGLAELLLRSLPSFRLYVQYGELYGRTVHAARHALATSRRFKACVDKAASSGAARSSTGLSAATAHLLHASQSASALLSGSGASSLSSSPATAVPVSADLFVLLDVVLRRLPHYSRYMRDMARCGDCEAAERERLLSAADKLDDLAAQTAAASAGNKPMSPQPLSYSSPHSAQRAAVVPLSAHISHASGDDSSQNSLHEPGTPSSSSSSSSHSDFSNSSRAAHNASRQSGGLTAASAAHSGASTPAPERRRMSLPPCLTDGAAVPAVPAVPAVLAAPTTPQGVSAAAAPVATPAPLMSPSSPAPSSHLSPPALQSPVSASTPPPLTAAPSISVSVNTAPAPAAPSSASPPPSSVFRYVPRIVLQRFLAIDSQLHTRQPHHSSRHRASLSLHHYLPSAATPATPAPDCQPLPASAILVADVSGFTKLNETFSVMEKGAGAEQVTTHLNRYFTALLNIIDSHGGDCVKFAGDALVVLFCPSREWSKRPADEAAGSGDGGGHPLLASVPSLGSSSALQAVAEHEAVGGSGGSTRDIGASIARLADDHNSSGGTGSGDYSSRGSGQFRFPLSTHPAGSTTQKQRDKDSAHEQSTLQTETCLRAVQCALQLQRDMGTYKGDLVELEPDVAPAPGAAGSAGGHRRQRSELTRGSVELSLHIAIGCGTVYGFHVGGLEDEFEFVLAGSAFGQLKDGVDLSKRGEVVVSKQAWEFIDKRCIGQPCYKQSKLCKTGDIRVTAVSQPIPLSPLPPLALSSLASHPFIPSALRCYVPRSVLDMLDAHANESGWLNEIRTVTVIFANLRGLELSKPDQCTDAAVRSLLHRTCSELQRVIARHQGYRRQFLVDDKGTTLIVVFGVPPFAHEDDAYRGVKCAIEMRDSLLALGVAHGMGITTGTVYSGSVGSAHRQEHAVVGDIVNAAARIAGKAESGANGTILIDAATHDKTSVHFEMRLEGEITVKGKQTKIKIYTPIRHDRLAVMGNAATQRTTGETLNRGAEMAEFMQSLVSLQHDTAPSPQSKVIMVEAEAGQGKTHLVRNFYRVVSTNLHSLHVIYAKGDATESSSLLGMWTPVMEQLMGLPPPQKGGAMVHKRTKQVHKFLKQVLPAHLANDPRLPYLNLVLSEPVQLPENELTKATRGQHKLMAKQAENVVYFLLQHAVAYERKQGKHTVMFAEDVHLMDASSVELLRRVAATIKALLLVCSCRPPHRRPAAVASTTEPSVGSALGSSGRKSALGELSSPEVSVSSASADGGGWEEKESTLDFISDPDQESSTISWKPDHVEEKALDTSTDNCHNTPTPSTITPMPVQRSFSASALDAQRGPTASISISSPASATSNPPSAPSPAVSVATSSTATVVDDSSVWGQHYLSFLRLPNVSHIQLSGLNQNTCTRLVCQRLHANSLDPQLSTLIFRRSRGNPLYAVEVASHLMEKGYLTLSRTGQCMVNPSLRDAQGRPVTVDEASLDLPVSLKGLVTRRLDSLPVMDLLVCKLASAFGYEEFERAMLVELCRDEGVDERQVGLSIDGLQQANILAVRLVDDKKPAGGEEAGEAGESSDGERGDTLYFCHELVHSACYDLLVMSQKLRLHFRLATMELRRTKATSLPPAQAADNTTAAPAATADANDAAGSSGPPSPAEPDTEASGGGGSESKADSGGGFAKRLAARLGRRRGDESTDASTNPTAATAAAGGASSNPSAGAVSGAELKRRASMLTYHYTMAIRCFTPHAAGDSNEMRAFIREAKDYLSQRLVAIPDDGGSRSGSIQLAAEEALEAIKTADSPALVPTAPPPPPPHTAWNDPSTPTTTASTNSAPPTASGSPSSAPSMLASAGAVPPVIGGGSGSNRPPPAPPASSGLFSGRRSWSGKQTQTKPAPVPVPQSTPATNRQLFGRAPPPLPAASSSSAVPAPYIRTHSTGASQPSPSFASSLDSPARNFLAEPPPTSHPVVPPPAMSPTGQQSPSHGAVLSPTAAPSPLSAQLRSPHSPPPLPFASPTASESSIHVTVAQLYNALASVGLSAELKDRVVAQLMGTTRNNYMPTGSAAGAASGSSPPAIVRAGSLPPPLIHTTPARSSPPPLPLPLSHSFTAAAHSPTPPASATSTDQLRLPRSASDVTASLQRAGGLAVDGASGLADEPDSGSAVSRSSEGSYHRVAGADGDADGQPVPDSPYTPPFHAPHSIPHQPPSPASTTDSQRSGRSGSFSSSGGGGAVAAAAAAAVVSVGVAIDGLVKMHREDVLSLRVLAKQAREPSAPVRRVVETTALLVSALQSTSAPAASPVKAAKSLTAATAPSAAAKPSPKAKTAADKSSKAPSWRDLFASSSFINTLVKCTPLTAPSRPNTAQPALPAQPQLPHPPLPADASTALRAAVNDGLLWKAAYARTLSPALKAVWSWVLAVCAECGVVVERVVGGGDGGGAGGGIGQAASGTSAAACAGGGTAELGTTGSAAALSGTAEWSADDSDSVTIIGAEAVRARARSRSMEQAAPVSPAPSSPAPVSPVSPAPAASPHRPSAKRPTTGTGTVTPNSSRRAAGKLSTALSLQPTAPSQPGQAGRAAADCDTPSPHSADVRSAGSAGGGGAGGGRSRCKRDAVPAASTRSAGNVHLSVNAAIKVRRGKGAATDK